MFPIIFSKRRRQRARRAAWICVSAMAVGMVGNGQAQNDGDSSGSTSVTTSITRMSQNSVTRRQAELQNIQQQMRLGDRRHADRDYGGALDLYREAFVNTPDVPAAQETKILAFQKYQVTARLYADELAKGGRREEGIAIIERVFADAKNEQLPVSAIDKQTQWMLEDLDDGVSYEHALSPDHLERVAQVKRLFVLANSYTEMGVLDKAKESYEQIIAIDPYNEAARRGLNYVGELMRNYYGVASDQARDRMLTQIDAMWENPVPRFGFSHLPNFEGLGGENPAEENSIQAKLNSMIIPNVTLEDTPLTEVLNFLNRRSIDLDVNEPDPSRKGVNFVLSVDDAAMGQTPVSLTLRDVPLGVVVDYVAQLAGMNFRVDGHAVVFAKQGDILDETMFTKRYRVPPTFISKSGGAAGGDPFGGGAPDPFGDLGNDGGRNAVLQQRVTPKDFLENSGVVFPPGSSVQYFPETSTLVVRNTRLNLELIETLVEQSFGNVTKMLKITVKQMEISEEDLTEIGFDWLLDQFNIPGSSRVFGSGGTYGSTSVSPGAGTSREYPFSPPNSPLPLGRFPTGGAIRTANDVTPLPGNLEGVSRSAATFGIGGVFTDPQFQLVIRAMRQKKAADLMSAGTVVTLAGQRASIRVIREFMYPSEYDPPEIPDQVGATNLAFGAGLPGGVGFATSNFAPIIPAHPTAFEMREVGSLLEVEGTIGEGGLINLTLTPEVVRFDGFIDYGSSITQFENDLITGQPFVAQNVPNMILQPVFLVHRVTTNVDIFDGETLVIGGLLGDKRTQVNDGIPGIRNIPLLGKLFEAEIQNRSQSAIMFFVTVDLVDPAGNLVRPGSHQEPLNLWTDPAQRPQP